MKKIIFILLLFVIIQNVLAKETYRVTYINHTLNISSSWLPSLAYVPANIGDSVSLYVYLDYLLTGCTEWRFSPSSDPWNLGPWDSIPGTTMVNPLSFIVTQYGSYMTFTGIGNQFIISPPAPPPIPGVINGRKNGVCNLSHVRYYTIFESNFILPVNFAWTVPAGATIISGQGTPSIRVNYPAGSISGQIAVTATSMFGTSPTRTLSITSTPVMPGTITGPVSVCSGSTGNAYSIPPVVSAINYTWTGPPGSHISHGSTTSLYNTLTTASASVTVQYGTIAPGSILKVKANNSCGSSNFRTFTLTPCGPRTAPVFAENESFQNIDFFDIYPTAVSSSITIQLSSTKLNDIEISIFDINGKQLKTDLCKNVFGELIKNENTETLSKGLYFLRIKAGDEMMQRKFVKM